MNYKLVLTLAVIVLDLYKRTKHSLVRVSDEAVKGLHPYHFNMIFSVALNQKDNPRRSEK